MHLRHIAQAFKSGEFNIPMFVHDQTPPGVETMKKLKDQIHYKYEAGGEWRTRGDFIHKRRSGHGDP